MSHRQGIKTSIQTAFIGNTEDDRRYRDEKRRKHGPRAAPDPVPDGPCCLRCGNWHKPEAGDAFGHCRLLVTVRERVPMGPQPGTTLGVEDVKNADYEWEFMRTRAGFVGCSRYAEKIEEAAA